MWGIVDILSATFSLTVFKAPTVGLETPSPEGVKGVPEGKGMEGMLEEYYQRRMLFDRIGDSLARIIISGSLFGYASFKIRTLEKK